MQDAEFQKLYTALLTCQSSTFIYLLLPEEELFNIVWNNRIGTNTR